MHELSTFNVENAHCFDPNEEGKLLKVIEAVGLAQFHERIHNLARLCSEKIGGNESSRFVRQVRNSAIFSVKNMFSTLGNISKKISTQPY
jgi:hypothetical protein